MQRQYQRTLTTKPLPGVLPEAVVVEMLGSTFGFKKKKIQNTKSTLKRQSKAGKMSIELKASWVHKVPVIGSYSIQ